MTEQTKRSQTAVKAKKPLDSARHPLAALLRDCGDWNRGHPLTLSMVLFFLLVNVLVRIFALHHANLSPLTTFGGQNDFRTSFIKLAHGRWYTAINSTFFVDAVWRIVLGVIVILFAMGVAETYLSRVKIGATIVVTYIIGLSSGLALCYLFQHFSMAWRTLSVMSLSLGPGILIIGPFMAAGAALSPLWRRRLYIFTYALISVDLLYRGEPIDYALLVGAFVGQACGFMFVRQDVSDFVVEPAEASEVWNILGIITAITGLGPLVSATSPIHAGPLSTIGLLLSPAQEDFGAVARCMHGAKRIDCYAHYGIIRAHNPSLVAVSALALVAILIIAWGIYRGRRTAVNIAIAWNAAEIILAVIYYFLLPVLLDVLMYDEKSNVTILSMIAHGSLHAFLVTSLLPFVLIVIYASQHRRFHIVTRRSRLYAGMVIIAVSFVGLSLLYYLTARLTSGPWVYEGDFLSSEQMGDFDIFVSLLTQYMPIVFLSFLRLEPHPLAAFPRLLFHLIGPLVWIIAIRVLISWFSQDGVVGFREHRQADRLVEQGGESMSFMTTWEGNEYWFSPSGKSAIAYRVYLGIALTVTGPFGDPQEYKQDLIDFTRFCEKNSWMPVFYAVHEDQRQALEDMQWSSLDVGTEMIIDPRQWKTTGKKWQDVRTAINKAKRQGIVDVLSTYQEASLDVRSQIIGISDSWADEKSLPEMKFTLGGVEELRDPRVKLLYAVDAQGEVIAVTSWLPTYRQGKVVGWTLDFMRHRPDAVNGIMEFLIARMAERLRDGQSDNPQGADTDDPTMKDVEFLSLSAAPLSGIQPLGKGSAVPTHVLQMTAKILEPAYGFHSLLFFKKKFQPQESHVFVAYPDASRLPQLALAVTHAYLPDMSMRDVISLMEAVSKKKEEK